jgi:hypothetical protein
MLSPSTEYAHKTRHTFQCRSILISYTVPRTPVSDSRTYGRMCRLSPVIQIRYSVGIFLMTDVPCMSLSHSITDLRLCEGWGLNSESSWFSTFFFFMRSLHLLSPRTLHHHKRQCFASCSFSPPTFVRAVWRNVLSCWRSKQVYISLQPTRIGDSQNRVTHGDICCFFYLVKGTWCLSWLRRWAASRKVAGSIPDGVNDIIPPAALGPWGRLSFEQE